MTYHLSQVGTSQTQANKMAATTSSLTSKDTIALELVNLIKRGDYSTIICPFKTKDIVPIEKFSQLELANWYELDTSKCFTGKHKLKINQYCVYEIYGSYCGKSIDKLRLLIKDEVKENYHWYNIVGRMYLDWKSISLDNWLKKQQYKNFKPDEICLYALNAILHHHAIVFTEYQPWCTVDIKPGMLPSSVEEVCETKLLYLEENLYRELHKKNLL